MYKIICNMKASRSIEISEKHLHTIENYSLFNELLDSNGIVDESVLDKLRLNVRSLLESNSSDPDLLDLCQNVLFHNNMKCFGLHQLILLYIDWEKEKLEALKPTLKEDITEE
ncbi:MAG: hypothetical protein J6W52_09055 [Bacteroidaceae bacterium]|nr:hypothetical protein [Bacteroidaceae bacterium]